MIKEHTHNWQEVILNNQRKEIMNFTVAITIKNTKTNRTKRNIPNNATTNDKGSNT